MRSPGWPDPGALVSTEEEKPIHRGRPCEDTWGGHSSRTRQRCHASVPDVQPESERASSGCWSGRLRSSAPAAHALCSVLHSSLSPGVVRRLWL